MEQAEAQSRLTRFPSFIILSMSRVVRGVSWTKSCNVQSSIRMVNLVRKIKTIHRKGKFDFSLTSTPFFNVSSHGLVPITFLINLHQEHCVIKRKSRIDSILQHSKMGGAQSIIHYTLPEINQRIAVLWSKVYTLWLCNE